MKALTILQPWASLVANNKKKIETRSWATSYRGPIAIHAGMGKQHIGLCRQHLFWSNLWPYEEIEARYSFQGKIDKFLPFGAVIAIANLRACVEITPDIVNIDGTYKTIWGYPFLTKQEIAFGDYTPGRYAWVLSDVRKIDPVPAKGMQRIWNWDGDNHD